MGLIALYQRPIKFSLLQNKIGLYNNNNNNENLPGKGGGPRSLVGILKRLVSAFCQGFRSLSEIDRHTFVIHFANFSALKSLSAFLNRMAFICHYFIWALSLLFGPCRFSEYTLAGPQ